MRQPILYAEEMWKRQRFWVLLLIGVGLAMTVLNVVRPGPGGLKLDLNTAVWLLYVPSGLVLLGILLYYRRRNRLEVGEEAVGIHNLLSAVSIPYDNIRSVRVAPLSQHFPEGRKKAIRPIARPLLEKPAVFIKLRGSDEWLAWVARKLGSQMVFDDVVAVPVPDPDAAAWELSSRLPERTGVNMGGQKRRKRR